MLSITSILTLWELVRQSYYNLYLLLRLLRTSISWADRGAGGAAETPSEVGFLLDKDYRTLYIKALIAERWVMFGGCPSVEPGYNCMCLVECSCVCVGINVAYVVVAYGPRFGFISILYYLHVIR
jgi:hypothetical protein